jgi:hypothetical protein
MKKCRRRYYIHDRYVIDVCWREEQICRNMKDNAKGTKSKFKKIFLYFAYAYARRCAYNYSFMMTTGMGNPR